MGFLLLQRNVTEHIPKIFDAVFECTLEMINKVGTEPIFGLVSLPDLIHYSHTFCLFVFFRTLRSFLNIEQTFSSFFKPWYNIVFKVMKLYVNVKLFLLTMDYLVLYLEYRLSPCILECLRVSYPLSSDQCHTGRLLQMISV